MNDLVDELALKISMNDELSYDKIPVTYLSNYDIINNIKFDIFIISQKTFAKIYHYKNKDFIVIGTNLEKIV